MTADLPSVTVSDRLRLICPVDPAIDFDAVEPAALQAYADLEDLDADKLPLKDGADPIWFTVAPLSKRELDTARALSGIGGDNNDDEDRTLAAVSFCWYMVRFGLRAIDGREWPYRRTRRRGVMILPEAALDALSEHEVGFLARVIGSRSGLPFGRAAHSGS